MTDGFLERLEAVRTRMRAACGRAGRDPDSARLLPVTKTVRPEGVLEAAAAGLAVFGENRVQEAQRKIALCPGRLEWHLIGHLQTNKARLAARLFSCIHSVDSQRLLAALETACAEEGRRMPVLLEVNLAGESSKFGFAPDETAAAVDAANGCAHLVVEGLMTVPPFDPDPERTRPLFRRLRELRDAVAGATGTPLPELSMGMSHDFEPAIEEGATWVRVGTALFGPRAKGGAA